MASHAPYLMPVGKRNKKAAQEPATGKEAHVNEMMRLARNLRLGGDEGAEVELAELRALQQVGTRRRRRWLNERALRELAGPLTVDDMRLLWAPPPFGVVRDSALQQLRDNKAAYAIWDSGFRNIDHDRQERVLEVWAEHNRTLKSKREGRGQAQDDNQREGEEAPKPSDPNLVSAQLALNSWGRISQQGRAALRNAHIHSVLGLELRVMEVQDEEDIVVDNGFGRLLIHSLASFHGLHSVASKDKTTVTIRRHHQDQKPLQIMCCDILGCLGELSKGIETLSPAILSRYIESQGLAAATGS